MSGDALLREVLIKFGSCLVELEGDLELTPSLKGWLSLDSQVAILLPLSDILFKDYKENEKNNNTEQTNDLSFKKFCQQP